MKNFLSVQSKVKAPESSWSIGVQDGISLGNRKKILTQYSEKRLNSSWELMWTLCDKVVTRTLIYKFLKIVLRHMWGLVHQLLSILLDVFWGGNKLMEFHLFTFVRIQLQLYLCKKLLLALLSPAWKAKSYQSKEGIRPIPEIWNVTSCAEYCG